jgi:hypothetical protein
LIVPASHRIATNANHTSNDIQTWQNVSAHERGADGCWDAASLRTSWQMAL